MDWNDLRYFLILARTGSLTEASRLLMVSASTVSRRIEELERSVGRSLFIRRQTGYRPSEAGEALLPLAEEIEGKALAFERAASSSDHDVSGLVRIATPELLGNEFLIPRLAPLQRASPGLRLDVLADVRPLRLSRHEADVLLRVTRPDHGRYKLRHVGALALGLYGSRDYLADRDTPHISADLAGHLLIGWVEDLQFLAHARWLREAAGDVPLHLRTNGMTAQYRATVAGMGLSVLPCAIAGEAGLIRVLTGEAPLRLELWLAIGEDIAAAPRVRAVADALVDILHRERDILDPPA